MRPDPAPPLLGPRARDPVAALASRPRGAPVPLRARPDVPSRPLAEVLSGRRSSRDVRAVDLGALAGVLATSAARRAGSTLPDGITLTTGPTPTAGGRTPHVLAVLAHHVDGLLPGLWVHDAGTSSLVRADPRQADLAGAAAAVREALRVPDDPPATIYAVATPARLLGRYPQGLALLWRDAGALLTVAHLVASDLGLGSCLVGTAGVLYRPADDQDAPYDTGALALTGA